MAKEKILVVEDEKDIVRLLRYNFEKEGYRVVSSGDGESALELARKEKPDLIVLDIMLPKMDGLEFCRLYRQEFQTPILFLTAKKSETDRVLGLKLGGDDYVVKPFSVAELLARVQAILRRSASAPAETKLLQLGNLHIDLDRYQVRVKGKEVHLTPKEFEFLKLLIAAKGKALSREQLLAKIWGHDESLNIDTRTVDQHIARLRQKLGSEGSRIMTVSHHGYRIKIP